MFKRIISLSLTGILLFTLSACMTEQTNPKQDQNHYDEDGMLGLTNTNPNLRTSPTHYNYDDDTRLISRTLHQVEGVLDSRVILNGANAYVKIRIPDGLSRKEIERIEVKARDALSFQLPRYEIHLTSDKSKLRRNQKVRND
jgi:hypothetical protein